jgi:hypothetical protein
MEFESAFSSLPLADNPAQALQMSFGRDQFSWVMFEHGTGVTFVDPPECVDLAAAAREIMSEWGPVDAGGPGGDFSVSHFKAVRAYAVTFDHPNVTTIVDPREVKSNEHLLIGLHGRSKRDRDAHELRIIHVEDKRSP